MSCKKCNIEEDIHICECNIKNVIKCTKLNDLAKIPTRGSAEAAGYDLYAATAKPIIIPAHQTIKIETGLAFELPKGTFGGIFARSGLATKQGLRPANCTGVVDSDYRGEVIVALHNDTDIDKIIEPQERIAQLIVIPYFSIDEFEVVESNEMSETDRGSNGFGSTGRQ